MLNSTPALLVAAFLLPHVTVNRMTAFVERIKKGVVVGMKRFAKIRTRSAGIALHVASIVGLTLIAEAG